ncbi:MAG: hypothetical protein M0R76_03255 [Proteobacteria bacterium]|nr:hypothetical protein [Pseudomonadota bacterium]
MKQKKQKKQKKKSFLNFLYLRLFHRNREHVGLKTFYNLYWVHPILRLTSKGKFLRDESPSFPEWIEILKSKGYKKVLILGNAPCLNELTPELFEHLRASGYLTIGLNRSIFNFQTDILLWSDLLTIDDILKKRAIKSNDTTILHVRHERNHKLPAAKDKTFQALHKYWSKNRNFKNWKKKKLFMFRNVAVSAMYLSWKLGIREILMVGFGFDDRGYFYKNEKSEQDTAYELFSDKVLAKNCGGYDTHKIVREVIEHLCHDEGFRIQYNGDSNFLSTISCLNRVNLADFNQQ